MCMLYNFLGVWIGIVRKNNATTQRANNKQTNKQTNNYICNMHIYMMRCMHSSSSVFMPFRSSKFDPQPSGKRQKYLMPRDIVSSQPRHWVVFGQLVARRCLSTALHRHDQLTKYNPVPWLLKLPILKLFSDTNYHHGPL